MIRVLRRAWIPIVLIVVIATAGFGVWRLHGRFGATEQASPSYVSRG
ncbi:MmpS family transport accessory protein [Mycobacterium sp. 141]|nr:MmpS family transport accessory protein [Mycobacterium sp. 141]